MTNECGRDEKFPLHLVRLSRGHIHLGARPHVGSQITRAAKVKLAGNLDWRLAVAAPPARS